MQIVRYLAPNGNAALGLVYEGQLIGDFPTPGAQLHELLRLSAAELRVQTEQALETLVSDDSLSLASLLAPVDGETELWAAGVTYKQSRDARIEESDTPDAYTKVYTAERPELFFKGSPRRVSGPDAPIAVRTDSSWDVPEPELVLVVNAHAEIVGYTIGNDVSSRSIEGENPLYLPQAKVYAGSSALGPGITPAWEVDDPYTLNIHMTVERDNQLHWQGTTSTSELKRRLDELVAFLFREDDFPGGVLLYTGTALVPERPFTLEAGDIVQITIDHLGILRNPVVRGKAGLLQSLQRPF